MPLRPLPYREVKRRLEAAGFAKHTQRGSHVKFVKMTDGGMLTVIVPHHRDVSAGVQRSMLRQGELTVEQWEQL